MGSFTPQPLYLLGKELPGIQWIGGWTRWLQRIARVVQIFEKARALE
jgi:hypothetical protein